MTKMCVCVKDGVSQSCVCDKGACERWCVCVTKLSVTNCCVRDKVVKYGA